MLLWFIFRVALDIFWYCNYIVSIHLLDTCVISEYQIASFSSYIPRNYEKMYALVKV